MVLSHTLAALATCVLPAVAFAQTLEPRPFPVQNVESFRYRSPSMGRTYDVSVGLPSRYSTDPDKKYPLLVVTDGNHMFPVAHFVAGSLMTQGDIEDLILVSIGAPFEEGYAGHVRRRVLEFSPPNWARKDPFGERVTQACRELKAMPEDQCTGGGPAFLEMISKELIPLVAARFRVDRDRLGLFGLSAGGFFASFAIFQPNSPFKTYLISSPAMGYGDGEIFRIEQRYAAEHKDLKVSIYMGSGGLELDDPAGGSTGRIVSGQAQLTEALRGRKYPGLVLRSEIHPNQGHSDAAATTFNRGLRLLYPRPKS